jgi:RecA-family ATPase
LADEPDQGGDEHATESELDDGPEVARAYREGFASIGKMISLAPDWDAKKIAFLNGLYEALTLWKGVDQSTIIDECFAIAEAKGLTEHFGVDEIQIGVADQVERAEHTPRANGKHRDPAADAEIIPQDPLPEPFDFISAAAFDGTKAPQRRWLVHDKIPMRNVTLLSGDGAVGKTTIALQLAVQVASHANDWIQNVIDEPGPVMFFTAEEELTEVHFRLEQIVDFYSKLQWTDLKHLHVKSMAEGDCVLAVPHRTHILAKTKQYERMELSIKQIQPKLVIMESAADLFAGNEIDRSQVRKFVSMLRELAIRYDCAIMLLSHPSVSGMASGSGMSGSTQWNNAVRSRMYFKTVKADRDSFDDDPESIRESGSDFRELQYLKNNRAKQGDKIKLVYTNGLFLPEQQKPPAEKAAQDSKADEMFMKLLRKFATDGSGRTVGVKTGTTYAPAMFAKDKEARAARITKAMLLQAMERLIADKKIRSIEFGPPSKLRNKLIEITSDGSNVLPFK